MARALSSKVELDLVLPGFSDEQPFDAEVGDVAVTRYVPSLRRSLIGHLGYEVAKTFLLAGLRIHDVFARRQTIHMMRISPIGISPIVARCLGSTVVVEVNGMPDGEFVSRGFRRNVQSYVRCA